MQTIYTLLTSSMNGVHAMGTSAVSFLDRTLAEETKAKIDENGNRRREQIKRKPTFITKEKQERLGLKIFSKEEWAQISPIF